MEKNEPVVITGEEAQIVADAKASLAQAPNLDNAIADMKRQLSKESKNTLIRQWIGLYAQVIQLLAENERLISEIKKLKSGPSGSESTTNTEASASEGE